jgi:trimeric autotransporter adhesin
VRRVFTRQFVAAIAACLLTACAGVSDFTGPTPIVDRVAGVELTPREVTLSPGGSATLQLTVRADDGTIVTDRTARWTSSDPAVVSVSETGVVAALAIGRAQVAVSVEGRSAVAQVQVIPRPVAAVDVAPGAPQLQVGDVVQLSATPRDEGGAALADRVVTWQTSDATIAVVDPSGFVTATGAGLATITATSEGRAFAVPIVVRPVPVARLELSTTVDTLVVGQSTQLAVRVSDAIGRTLLARDVAWTARQSAVASVTATGLVVAQSPGSALIVAESEGVRDSVRIVVQPRPVGAVIVSPAQATLTVGQFLRLLTQVTDDNGAVLPGRPVRYTSRNPAVALVSADGEVRAVAQGDVVIDAESEGRRGTMTLTVRPTPVATVRIMSPGLSLSLGDSLVLRVEALDAAGQALTGRAVTWTSGAPSLFSVSAGGVVRAIAPGTGLVFALVDGRLASLSLTVRPVVVARVEIAPTSAELIVQTTRTYTATARDSSGRVILGRPVQWASAQPAVAVVSSEGVVRAVSIGAAEVSATIDGVRATLALLVVPVPVASVSVVLSAPSVTLGATTQATATTRDATGLVITGRAVTWRSSNDAVATVSAAGVVTAVALGTADIVATSEGVTGSARLTVTPIPVARVDVSAPDSTLIVHDTVQATAVVRSSSGAVLTGRALTWTSADTTKVRVNATGRLIAVGVGTTTVSATSEGVTGTLPVQVSPAPVASVNALLGDSSLLVGVTTPATAVLRDARGNVLTGRTVTWATSNATVATVNATTGLVTAVGAGTATITGTSEGVSDGVVVTVSVQPVATVALSAPDSSLVVFDTVPITAVLRDAGGSVLTGRTITWSTSNAAVATVSGTGRVAAVSVGSATVTATSEGVSSAIVFSVAPAPVASVNAVLGDSSLLIGETTNASAVLRDARGNVLTGRTVTWATSNSAVATVNTTTGLVTAVGSGTATITGTSEGVSDGVVVTVNVQPVATVALSAPDSSLIVFDTVQVTAVLRDAGGNVLTGRAITWTTSNGAVATVSATGRVAAAGVGSATITGTSEGVSSTIVFTVALAPVATVNALLGDSSLTVGATTNATAELRDARGNIVTGRTITWATSDATVATVNATTGLVTAVAVGTATISGTSEGVSDGVLVTVSAAPPAPVATVELSAPDSSLIVFDTVQVTAVLKDAGGNTLTGRTITWATSSGAIATVSSTGQVAAVSVGSATITATSEGVSSTIVFSVALAPVATVNALLGDSSLTVGATTNATAELRDARGNIVTGRTITWASSDATIATVSATTGLVTAVTAGTATITGTSEGVSDGVLVTVSAVPPAPVATVELSAPDSSLIVFDTVQVTAVLKDAGGNTLTGRTITWSTSNSAVATVSTTGQVAAAGVGSATITATSEGVSSTIVFTVAPAPVATVNALLGDSSLTVGTTTNATAELRDARGNVVTGRTITWATSDAAIATVNATTGLVTAVAAGTATITGTSEGVSDGVLVTVSAAPPPPVATVELSAPDSSLIVFDTVQISAVLKDAGGNTLTGRTITWATSNGAIATVSSTGQVAAVSVGSATITATSEGVSSTIVFTVAVAPVASVNALLGDSSLTVGTTTNATAELRDARGNLVTGRTITWASSDATIATVNATTGLVTAVAAGTATITGSSEGVSDGVTVTVTAAPPAPVAAVELSAPDSSLIVFDTVQITAVLKDAGGNVLTGRTITWATSNGAIAIVSSTGQVAAAGVGSATITATSEGVSSTIVFTVAPAPVATVNALLGDSSLTVGATTNATAELRDARGNIVTGRTITWATSDAAVATVDASTGLVTAIAAGTATITGTSEGISDGVSVAVAPPPPAPVATVELSAPDSSLIVHDTVAVTVVLKDAGGNVLTGRTITWASSDSSKATISPAGQLVARDTGTVTISATSEGVTSTLTVTIALAPVATVAVTLPSTTLAIGATTTATAELRDARGNIVTGRTITWATSDAAVATVNPTTGLVTAIAAGTATITATSEGVSNGAPLTVTTP